MASLLAEMMQILLRAGALNENLGLAGFPQIPTPADEIRRQLAERERRADINPEGIRAQAEKFHALNNHNISNFGQAIENLELVPATEIGSQAPLSDIETYIKEGRNKALSAAIQNAQKDAERCFFEGHLHAMTEDWREESQEIRLALGNGRILDPPVPMQATVRDLRMPGPSLLTDDMKLFAKVVRDCSKKDASAVVRGFRNAAREMTPRGDLEGCWPVLESLLAAPSIGAPAAAAPAPAASGSGALASDGGMGRIALVPAVIACLQSRFYELMQEVLERNNIPSAKLSTRETIEKYTHYMCKHHFSGRGSEKNAKVYFAWRCGHPEIAAEFDELFEGRYRDYLASSRRPDLKSGDVFELQIANVLARNHASEAPLATCFDDWLWIKLLTLPVRAPEEAFAQLQQSISVQFGETYFDADQYPLRYVTTLTLTMQFEKAVEFLWRTDVVTAVHYAIACLQAGRLVCSPRLRGDRLENQPSRVSVINLAQLISVYARTFVKTDPQYALAYFALIKDVPLDQPSGQTCLERAVCDLVLESGDWELVFGSNNPSDRKVGLARQLLSSEHEWKRLVQAVAKESDHRGRFNDALRLYDLCEMRENVVQLLIRLLGQEAASPGPKRAQLRLFTDNILQRYDPSELSFVPELSKIMKCFELYQENRFNELAAPLDDLYRKKILPRRDEDVRECIEHFRRLSPEIQSNMPLLLLCAMKSLQCQLPTAGAPVRKAAQALMGYTSALPYRTPESIRGELLRINQSMLDR